MAGKSNEDFLADLVRQFAAVAPELGPIRLDEISRDVARHIRRDWGGCRPYIPKPDGVDKAQAVAQARATGADLQTAFRCADVSRSTGYRLIRRK